MEAALVHLSGFAAGASSALVASIWQGMLLAGCVALCLRMVPRLSAASRSMVWLVVFVVVGVLDVVWPVGVSSGGQGGGMHLDAGWGLGLAGLWALLTSVQLARLAVGAVRLEGVARRATPFVEDAGQASSRSEPLVCTSAEVDRPGVVGFFAPRILLPAGLRERLSEAEFEAVLMHEREHLRRGDDWTNLLQKTGLALMPLNPVLAWVERRLCRERELACDDCVLRQTRARKVYAACLARLAEDTMLRRPLALALGLAGRGSELGRRVHRILGQPEAVLGRWGAVGMSGVLIAGLLGGGFELARCPQMVRFEPRVSSASIAQDTGSARNVSFGYAAEPHLVRAVARTDTPELRVPATERHRKLSRKPSLMKVSESTGRARAQQKAWVVMKRWTLEGVAETAFVPVGFVVSAEYSTSSYAVVPVRSDWLVFQL